MIYNQELKQFRSATERIFTTPTDEGIQTIGENPVQQEING